MTANDDPDTRSDPQTLSPPRVSVIVPHYNDLIALDRCLTALSAQTFPAGQREIIVADNGSTVGEAAVAAVVAGRARLVVEHARGAGPARNAGVLASRGTVLAFTDSDCVPVPGWIAAGLAGLDGFDFIGGHVSVLVGDPAHMTAVEAFETVFAFDFRDYIERKGFTGSGNMFVTRAVFDRVGGFGTGVSEDVDWSHRARKAGFTLGYAPAAEVAHPARTDWRELMAKWRRVQSETFKLALSQKHGRMTFAARTWAMPVSALAHTPRVLGNRALPDLPTRLRALGVLYRLRGWRFVDGNRKLFGHDG